MRWPPPHGQADRGTLPNGAGLDLARAGVDDAGDNRRAVSVIWQWVDTTTKAVVLAAGLRHQTAAGHSHPMTLSPRTVRVGAGLALLYVAVALVTA